MNLKDKIKRFFGIKPEVKKNPDVKQSSDIKKTLIYSYDNPIDELLNPANPFNPLNPISPISIFDNNDYSHKNDIESRSKFYYDSSEDTFSYGSSDNGSSPDWSSGSSDWSSSSDSSSFDSGSSDCGSSD